MKTNLTQLIIGIQKISFSKMILLLIFISTNYFAYSQDFKQAKKYFLLAESQYSENKFEEALQSINLSKENLGHLINPDVIYLEILLRLELNLNDNKINSLFKDFLEHANNNDSRIPKIKRIQKSFVENNEKKLSSRLRAISENSKSSTLTVIYENKLYGFVNNKGEEVISPQYELAGSFSEGLAPVRKNGKYIYINNKNETIITTNYEMAFPFSEGLARVFKNSKWGFIDKSGEEIIPLQYVSALDFKDNLAQIQKYRNGSWGGINKVGKEIIPVKYDFVGELISENTVAVKENKKWSLFHTNGEQITSFMYDVVWPVSDGLSFVAKNNKGGYIDVNGNTVIPFIYDGALSFHNGVGLVKKGGKMGAINNKGKTIIPFNYKSIQTISNGLHFAKNTYDKIGFIDSKGKTIIPFEYDAFWPCYNERIPVKKNGQWGLIDKENKIVVPFGKYDLILQFNEGLAPVATPTKAGAIDINGNLVIPIKYDFIKSFKNGLAITVYGNKIGFIDTKGNVVVPFEYTNATPFDKNGIAQVKKNGKWIFINKRGEVIKDFWGDL